MTDNTEDWRQYRRQRNICNRLNKTNKQKYFEDRLNKPDKNDNNLNNNDKDINTDKDNNDTQNDIFDNNKYCDRQMWKTVKDMTNTNTQKPPTLILIYNKLTTSLQISAGFDTVDHKIL